ncbi:MAG: FadR family transcriptional regulator [Micrococcales bacterium]|nr:FadR family transcriptional regulator [Micrococcales bacterium]
MRGEISAGTKLEGEDALAARYEVSRPVVREALVRLRERGYVETTNGKGTFVREPNLDNVAASLLRRFRIQEADASTLSSTEHVYQARTAIEQETARLAALNATADDVAQLHGYIDTMQRVADVDNVAYTTADVSFHLQLAESTHNPLFGALLAPLIQLIVKGMYESVREVREGMEAGTREHARIVELIETRDSEGARAAMIEHLQHSLTNSTRASSQR